MRANLPDKLNVFCLTTIRILILPFPITHLRSPRISRLNSRHLRFALNHQRCVEIHGFEVSELLDVFLQWFIETIETEIVLREINFFEKPLFHNRIVRRIHLAFKNGFLDALPVILTYLGYAAQPPPAFRRFRGHIVGD